MFTTVLSPPRKNLLIFIVCYQDVRKGTHTLRHNQCLCDSFKESDLELQLNLIVSFFTHALPGFLKFGYSCLNSITERQIKPKH